jgi:Na+-translocating ferredoxin:NAD+ oxidoreductase subunit G
LSKAKLFIQESWLLIACSFFFGLAIAAADAAWQGKIQLNQENKFNNIAREMLADAASFETALEDAQIDSGRGGLLLTTVKKGLAANGSPVGWAFTCEGSGFADKIKLVLAVDAKFERILGYGVLASSETPGFGDKIKTSFYKDQFIGAPAELLTLAKTGDVAKVDSEIVAITGATVSSKAVVDMVDTFLVQIKDQMRQKGLIDNGK